MSRLPYEVQQIIDQQVSKLIRKDSEAMMQDKLLLLKSELIEAFLNHPVTEEILAGPEASNTSGTLGGYGNLFSFIGFEVDDKPIAEILKIFESIDFVFSGEVSSGNNFKVTFPTAQDIFDVTPMPWATGRSWAKGIETGISGLGYYIFRKNAQSRSEHGIQTSVNPRGSGQFSNTKYISDLLNKYKMKFLKLS
jgi:hypothetical protein